MKRGNQMTLLDITKKSSDELNGLNFSSPVTHIYNPLDYAWQSHSRYLSLYGQAKREILFIGMNPGPWGMVQNGIPFGDQVLVREWLEIQEPIGKPPIEHPKRPVLGLSNTRREVSGKRLWGWAQSHFETPKRFFQQFFVVNYCPLAFLSESGQNLTPDKLPVRDRDLLLKICDCTLVQMVDYFQPTFVIGVGGFAEQSALRALQESNVRIGRIPHPSPANPIANRGWEEAMMSDLNAMGICLTR